MTSSKDETARPADIVSPTSDGASPTRVKAEEAVRLGRFGYDKPTPQNAIMLFIDHQIGLMAGVRDFPTLSSYKSNVVALAMIAKALDIPTMVMTRPSFREQRRG